MIWTSFSDDAMYLSHFTMVCHLKKNDSDQMTVNLQHLARSIWDSAVVEAFNFCTTKMSERKLAMMYTWLTHHSIVPKLNLRAGKEATRTSLTVEGRTTNCCSISADAAVPAAIQAPLVGVGEGCCMEFGIRKSANLTFCGLHGPFEHGQFVKI